MTHDFEDFEERGKTWAECRNCGKLGAPTYMSFTDDTPCPNTRQDFRELYGQMLITKTGLFKTETIV